MQSHRAAMISNADKALLGCSTESVTWSLETPAERGRGCDASLESIAGIAACMHNAIAR